MSIILKGIDLDEITAGNGYARLEIEEDGTVVDDISDIIIAQAIQIPTPHGRLIDGGFEEMHYTSMTTNPTPDVTEQDKANSVAIVRALQMAHTILEAEE